MGTYYIHPPPYAQNQICVRARYTYSTNGDVGQLRSRDWVTQWSCCQLLTWRHPHSPAHQDNEEQWFPALPLVGGYYNMICQLIPRRCCSSAGEQLYHHVHSSFHQLLIDLHTFSKYSRLISSSIGSSGLSWQPAILHSLSAFQLCHSKTLTASGKYLNSRQPKCVSELMSLHR